MGGVTLKFAVCMRAHGMPNFPDPNSQGEVSLSNVNPNSTIYTDAQKACVKYTGARGKPPSSAQQQRFLARAVKFAQCMRSHGITDYPDPTVGANGAISTSIRAGQGSNLNPNNPQFQKAQKACGIGGKGGSGVGLTP